MSRHIDKMHLKNKEYPKKPRVLMANVGKPLYFNGK
jgi:hypothetical protein